MARKDRFLVGSLGSLLWPAAVVLVPIGITFAATRVHAEGGVIPKCDSGAVIACADASPNAVCSPTLYEGERGKGVCTPTSCLEGTTADNEALICYSSVVYCSRIEGDCAGKAEAAPCNGSSGGAGRCAVTSCAGEDAGFAVPSQGLICVSNDAGASSSGSTSGYTSDGTTSGTFIPGPDTVPGSSGTPAPEDKDEGCSASTSTSVPLLGAPLTIGLLLALRRRRRAR